MLCLVGRPGRVWTAAGAKWKPGRPAMAQDVVAHVFPSLLVRTSASNCGSRQRLRGQEWWRQERHGEDVAAARRRQCKLVPVVAPTIGSWTTGATGCAPTVEPSASFTRGETWSCCQGKSKRRSAAAPVDGAAPAREFDAQRRSPSSASAVAMAGGGQVRYFLQGHLPILRRTLSAASRLLHKQAVDCFSWDGRDLMRGTSWTGSPARSARRSETDPGPGEACIGVASRPEQGAALVDMPLARPLCGARSGE